MIRIHRSAERGFADHGWLKTHHTFSFADYFNPQMSNFRSLRVINEDFVAAGQGFPTHPHRDMEIVTYILEGALRHQDSTGTSSVIRPGDAQRMTAGTGITHSEFNDSKEARVHLLQIWILPEERGLTPGYQQKHFTLEERTNRLCLLASRDGSGGSIAIHQDVKIFCSLLARNHEAQYNPPNSGRHNQGSVKTNPLLPRYQWVQVARGVVDFNGHKLEAGDAAEISPESESGSATSGLSFRALTDCEFLLFDLV